MQARKHFIKFCLLILFILFVNVCYRYYRSYEPLQKYTNELFLMKYFIKDYKFTSLVNAVPFTCGNQVTLVLVVLCETSNYEQRKTIRNTWGQWLNSKYSINLPRSINSIDYYSNRTKLVFVMGAKSINLKSVQQDLDFIQNETHFNDIMYFPGLLDTYMNLTLKTLTGLNVARQKCTKATFFLKADTDVFVNVPRLLGLCHQHLAQSKKKAIIVGNEQFNAPVIRDKNAKWYVPYEVYSKNYFPPYVTGCGYLLNSKAIDSIVVTASKVKRLFYWEDVAVTGMYSTNVELIDNKLFRYEEYMNTIDSCNMRIIILAHRITPSKMISLWNEITSNTTICSFSPNLSSSIKRFEYVIKSMIFG